MCKQSRPSQSKPGTGSDCELVGCVITKSPRLLAIFFFREALVGCPSPETVLTAPNEEDEKTNAEIHIRCSA